MRVIDANGRVKVITADLSPGAGSSGWTDTRVPFANPTGQLTESAGITFDDSTDALSLAGDLLLANKLVVGDIGWGASDIYGMAHEDNANTTDYALIQSAAGQTFVNAKTGTGILLSVNNSAILSVAATTVTVANGVNFVLNATTGSQIATTASQKLAVYGTTPVVRQGNITQTYSTASSTHAARTAASVATTGATNVGPFGYTTAAQANAIVTELNALKVDADNTAQVLNRVVDWLQAYGWLGTAG